MSLVCTGVAQASKDDLQRVGGPGAASTGALLRDFVYHHLSKLSAAEVAALDAKSAAVYALHLQHKLSRSDKFYNQPVQVISSSLPTSRSHVTHVHALSVSVSFTDHEHSAWP